MLVENLGKVGQIEAIVNGDEKLIEELYKLWRPKCYNYVINNSGSQEDAEDCYLEAFIELIRKCRIGTTIDQDLPSYLNGINRNIWLSELRRRKIKGFKALDEMLEKLVNEELIQDENDYEEFNHRLQKALKQLSKSCQEMLMKFYGYDYSHQELAEEFGYSSEEVSRTKIKRCKKYLKEKY